MTMTTAEIINQMEKEFDEKFRDMKDSWNVDVVGYDVTKQDIKSFYLKHIRTLLESFGEEVIGENEIQREYITDLGIKDDFEGVKGLIRNTLRTEQRLKVKEIIEEVGK